MTLKTATIRDFSGGWNVADNPHNLASKYLPVSDNVMVGVDGSLSPRFGSRAFANYRQGTVTQHTQTVTFTTVTGSPTINVQWSVHPFNSGDHINIKSLVLPIPNIPVQPSGLYGVIKIDANNFKIVMRQSATANGTLTTSMTCERDNHLLAGNVVDSAFFQSFIIVFDDIGEIIKVDPDSQTITRIWDASLAAVLPGAPAGWRKQQNEVPLNHVAFDVFRQGLLCVNGRFNDKPIEINFQRPAGQAAVQFLLDPGASGGATNGFIYAADFIQSFDSYVILYGSNNTTTLNSNTPTTVDISAKNTNCLYVGAPDSDDAVQIDLGRVTQTVEPRITGVANIRDKVFVSFYDSAMLGKLGIKIETAGGGSMHEPDFSDQIPQHGAINNRVIVNMGNDLLMCDYAGVPAFTQSQQTGTIVPERISQLVDPELNKHLSRLSQATLASKAFAVFNVRDRQYMLFVPKFDSASVFKGAATPFYITSTLYKDNTILVHAPSHTVDAGDYVDVSGAVDMSGLSAAHINGRRKVRAVVDTNYFLMEVGTTPLAHGVSGGGTVTFAPVDDETIGYVFAFNPQLKIRRWTRFRDLYFTSGVLSRDGRVYFTSPDGWIYEWGTSDRPYYADAIGHPANPDGRAINFVAETPWSDFGDRLSVKSNQTLRVDAQGSGRFTVNVFTDNIYQDAATLAYMPSARTEFTSPSARTDLVANDAGGFGAGTQTYGGGRRTREQLGFHFPFRCQIAKLRIEGSASTLLKISGIHMQYLKGSSYR